MSEICVGCGAKIQTNNPAKQGYIDQSVLNKRPDTFYCKRCFTLKHYNRNIEYPIDSNAYKKTIDSIKKSNGLMVYVCDVFDLEGTIIKNLNEIYNSRNLIIVANKVDLFIKSININKVEMYIKNYLKKTNIEYLDLLLVSSFKHNDIVQLIDIIKLYRNGKNVYFLGMTNVGKSSIINRIIKIHTNIDDLITVSNMINTTLDNIEIPFDENSYLIDTPGIINEDALTNYLSKETLEKITPDSYVKPKSFQLNPQQTLFIAGFVRIDFINGIRSSFVTNFRNDLLIHRTKLENADEFYKNHYVDILKIPNLNEIVKLGNIKEKTIIFSDNNKIDIVISGIGFVTLFGEGEVKVKTFDKIKIIVRKAVI